MRIYTLACQQSSTTIIINCLKLSLYKERYYALRWPDIYSRLMIPGKNLSDNFLSTSLYDLMALLVIGKKYEVFFMILAKDELVDF